MKRRIPFVPALLIGAIISYFVVSTWGFAIGKVKGCSMEPTYHDGTLFIVRSYELLFRNPRKGEVVVLKDNGGFTVIKRIALTPGELDTISPTREPHVLRNNEYVVLGDNTENSTDSRVYGPVRRNQLIGIVK